MFLVLATQLATRPRDDALPPDRIRVDHVLIWTPRPRPKRHSLEINSNHRSRYDFSGSILSD